MPTVTTKPINGIVELETYIFDSTDLPSAGSQQEVKVPYYSFSVAVHNLTSNDVKVWTNKYAVDSTYTIVPPGGYKEFAVVTDYVKIEGVAASDEKVVVDLVKTVGIESLLSPLYPNLIIPAAEAGAGFDIQLNPINLGGYAWTPFVNEAGEPVLSWEEGIADVEYYFLGDSIRTSNSANFYVDFYDMVMNKIVSMYPSGFTPGPNPPYDPTTLDKVTEQIKDFLLQWDAPLNDEFINGWANLHVYDDALKRTEVFLTGGTDIDKFETPFTVLGWTVEALNSTNVDMDYSEDGVTWTNITVTTSQTVTEPTKFWRVNSGEAKITFSGFAVKMIEFAPIINIFYPVGFDDTDGLPADAYASWQAQLTEFKNRLRDSKFTGRVVYWRAVPFETKKEHPVFKADHIVFTYLPHEFELVFQFVRRYAQWWYSPSKLEKDLLTPIIYENYSYYYGTPGVELPKNLLDVVADPNVTVFGTTTTAEKIKKLEEILAPEYFGTYSRGGIKFWTNI